MIKDLLTRLAWVCCYRCFSNQLKHYQYLKYYKIKGVHIFTKILKCQARKLGVARSVGL
jgi:hypothetical protein